MDRFLRFKRVTLLCNPHIAITESNWRSSADILLLAAGTYGEVRESASKTQFVDTFFHTVRSPKTPADTDSRALLVVTSDKTLTPTGLPQFPHALLHDTQNTLIPRFVEAPASHVFVSIDRAGFLRRIERVISPADVSRLLAAPLLEQKVEVGSLAPNFSMPDSQGTLRRLADLRGRRNILLTFFPKCFTGGCISHLSSLQRELPALENTETDVWANSVDAADGEKGQRAFAASLGVIFSLIPDTGRNLSILYGAANSPNQFAARISILIDKNGIVRWIDKQVQPKTHGSDVLQKIKELEL